MRKSNLLKALQLEIGKHSLSTFVDEKDRVVKTGCPAYRKHFGTNAQFVVRLCEDVILLLSDKLSRTT